jgi:hypothetical protein
MEDTPMPDPNPTPDAEQEPFDASKAVTSAILDAINSQHQAALMRSHTSDLQVHLNLTGTAAGAAKAFIMSEAQRQLCNAGHLTTLTCSDSPGHAFYYFDFNTTGPDRRIEVGVTMDSDRVDYLVKKVSGWFK